MQSYQQFVGGLVLAFSLAQDLNADEPRNTERPPAAVEEIAVLDEQIEQITREYRKRLGDLEKAYKAEIEQARAKYSVAMTASASQTKLPSTGASVVVFTQFRPNAKNGPRHVLHILTSDGRSRLIPYEFLEQKNGNWRRVPDGIEYTWKGRDSSGSAIIDFNPIRRGYSHPNARHDDLVNGHGHLVVGDPAFLLAAESAKIEVGGEPNNAREPSADRSLRD